MGIYKPFLFLLAGSLIAVIYLNSRSYAQYLPVPPLKTLAAKNDLQIGNYAALKRLNEQPYKQILTSQYDFITVDGELNWTFNDGSLRPAANKYDFSNPDKVFAFAHSHNMPVQAHHLVWGEDKWLPAWLKDGSYSPNQLLNLIHQHITTVAGHYRGQVREWSVVNEAFTRGMHVKGLHDWWADHIGNQSYIDQSFIWAHQADPHAKLLLNDFNSEGINSVSDAMYGYVTAAKQRGIPIDGVGLQMHIDASNPPQKQDVIRNMQRFGKLGVGIYVTEFDVDMSRIKGSSEHKNDLQALIYHNMLRACIESKYCHSFAELGITDKESWYNDLGVVGASPLPFDDKYRPKPAFYALRYALRAGN